MSGTNNVYWDTPNICPVMNNSGRGGGNMTEWRRENTIVNDIVKNNNIKNSAELKKYLEKYQNPSINAGCDVVPHGDIILPKQINLP
jgi:hypothetical protein